MNTVSQILIFFGNNTPIVSFLGAIIGGEEVLVLLSIYSVAGTLNLAYILIFFYLGIMVSDTLWYMLGKSRIFAWLIRLKFISSAYEHWGRLLDVTTRKNDFQALFMTKFFYGFRIATIMYLARERLSFRDFFKYSLLSNFVWVGFISALGWATGKGIKTVTYFSGNITLEVFLVGVVLVLFMVIMRVASIRVKKWLQKTSPQSN
ncbi:MAG: hypothetical protein HYX23_02275 [Candidatus Zambryskibacteria bacterium]|nr:hypothetical protein [Candidatus Zambryskibacteria bacterium]